MSKLDDSLGLLLRLEARLQRLRNTWPCGIRSIDDRTDLQIKHVSADLEELKPKIKALRAAAKVEREGIPRP